LNKPLRRKRRPRNRKSCPQGNTKEEPALIAKGGGFAELGIKTGKDTQKKKSKGRKYNPRAKDSSLEGGGRVS